MGRFAAFECDGCSLQQVVYADDRSRCYRLGDRQLPLFARFAWCEGCGRLVQAEDLAPLREIEEELKIAGADRPFAVDWWGRGRWTRLIEMTTGGDGQVNRGAYLGLLSDLRDWRRGRSSPARCLICGAVELREIRHDKQRDELWLPHPGCHGTLRQVGGGVALTEGLIAEYSAEGETSRLVE